MATEQEVAVTKADLDASVEVTHGYIDTAVDTLTAEMDRQFKEVCGDIARLDAKVDRRFDEVLKAIKEHQHGS